MSHYDEQFEKEVKYALKCMEEGSDLGLPLHLFPSASNHTDPQDGWDEWENQKFREQMQDCNSYWLKAVAKARRLKKLERMREQNPLYCNKHPKNIKNMEC